MDQIHTRQSLKSTKYILTQYKKEPYIEENTLVLYVPKRLQQ